MSERALAGDEQSAVGSDSGKGNGVVLPCRAYFHY